MIKPGLWGSIFWNSWGKIGARKWTTWLYIYIIVARLFFENDCDKNKKTRTSSPKLSKSSHFCRYLSDICQCLMPKRKKKKSLLKDDVNISSTLNKEWCSDVDGIVYGLFVFNSEDRLNIPIISSEHPDTTFTKYSLTQSWKASVSNNSISPTAFHPITKHLLYTRAMHSSCTNVEFYFSLLPCEVVIFVVIL